MPSIRGTLIAVTQPDSMVEIGFQPGAEVQPPAQVAPSIRRPSATLPTTLQPLQQQVEAHRGSRTALACTLITMGAVSAAASLAAVFADGFKPSDWTADRKGISDGELAGRSIGMIAGAAVALTLARAGVRMCQSDAPWRESEQSRGAEIVFMPDVAAPVPEIELHEIVIYPLAADDKETAAAATSEAAVAKSDGVAADEITAPRHTRLS